MARESAWRVNGRPARLGVFAPLPMLILRCSPPCRRYCSLRLPFRAYRRSSRLRRSVFLTTRIERYPCPRPPTRSSHASQRCTSVRSVLRTTYATAQAPQWQQLPAERADTLTEADGRLIFGHTGRVTSLGNRKKYIMTSGDQPHQLEARGDPVFAVLRPSGSPRSLRGALRYAMHDHCDGARLVSFEIVDDDLQALGGGRCRARGFDRWSGRGSARQGQDAVTAPEA